jgi:nitrate/nitrite transport system permease protein
MSAPAPMISPAKPAGGPPGVVITFAKPDRRKTMLGFVGRTARATAELVIPPLVVVILLLMLWQLGCGPNSTGVPAPLTIWRDSHDLIMHPFYDHGGTDKGLFWQVATSLSRVGLGFSLAAIVGVALGVLIGASKWAHRGLDPIFQVLRTVPPLAWLPISLAAFQQAQPSALFVIFITSIWPVIINTAVGVRNIPQDYINVSRVLRLSPFEHFWKVLLPATAPYIFTGLRIGVGMSWLAIIASEMLLGGVGVGFFIWDQYNASRIADIVVALVWVGLVGFALDRAVALVGGIVSRGTAQS